MLATSQQSGSSAKGARFGRRCVSRSSPVSGSVVDRGDDGVVDRSEAAHEIADRQCAARTWACVQDWSVSWHLRISRTASRIGISLRMMRACFSKMPSVERPLRILIVAASPSTICTRSPLARWNSYPRESRSRVRRPDRRLLGWRDRGRQLPARRRRRIPEGAGPRRRAPRRDRCPNVAGKYRLRRTGPRRERACRAPSPDAR